jgi:gamma-glutamylcyclotransferase (GGCT)/AIG2-like uncharacterized protein YtfP
VSDVLFVYGSLRSEFDNPFSRFVREKAQLIGHARVRGSIYLVGKYPGYRPEPDGEVHGEVWRMGNAEAVLAILDDYEGAPYKRILVPTSITGLDAWIYVYEGEVKPENRIVSGDFLTS